MDVILAVAITWLVSPVAYWVLTRLYRVEKTFPVNVTGAIGDTVFLPVFNGLVVYLGVLSVLLNSQSLFWFAVIGAVTFSMSYLLYRKNLKESNDWMRSEKGRFNFAGWYHFVYVFLQSFIIILSFLYFYASVWLWLMLVGYVATVLVPVVGRRKSDVK